MRWALRRRGEKKGANPKNPHLNEARYKPVLVDGVVGLGGRDAERDVVWVSVRKNGHERCQIDKVRRQLKGSIRRDRPGSTQISKSTHENDRRAVVRWFRAILTSKQSARFHP